MSQISPLEEIFDGQTDYDAVRAKTARGAVIARPTEAAMQPTMDAYAWIHSANQDS
jgi:hypothetical protein